jgi:hypothetical protein
MKYVPQGDVELVINENICEVKQYKTTDINKRYLSHTDIDIHQYNTIFVKSIEGTAKSHAILDHIANNTLGDQITKYIIVNPNVSTLSSITDACREKNIACAFYKKATKEELNNARVVIISINSLHLLLTDGVTFNGNLNKTMLWIDELTIVYKYFRSDTVEKRRTKVYNMLKTMIKHCKKVVACDADLCDASIKILADIRKDPNQLIIYNRYKHVGEEVRNYHVSNTLNEWMIQIKKSLENGENIYIVSDSKTVTDQLFIRTCLDLWGTVSNKTMKKHLEKLDKSKADYKKEWDEHADNESDNPFEYKIDANKRVCLINSENHNTPDFLIDLNKIIMENNIQVLIASPSLSVGTNISIDHFTTLFAVFKGQSVCSEVGQQQLNRCRKFKGRDHYIHFMNCRNSSLLTTDQACKEYSEYIAQLIKDENKVITTSAEFIVDDDGTMTYTVDPFFSDMMSFQIVKQRLARNNFVYRVLANITQRGFRVFLTNKSYKSAIRAKQRDKVQKKLETGIKEFNTEMTVDQFIDAKNIDDYTGRELLVRSKTERLEKVDQWALQKYIFKQRYHIKEGVDIDELRELYIATLELDYYRCVINLMKFVTYVPQDDDAVDPNNVFNIAGRRMVKQLLELCGFSGLFDQTTFNYTTTEEIPNFPDNMLKRIRAIFSGDSSVRVYFSKPTWMNVMNLLSKLIGSQLGIFVVRGKYIQVRVKDTRIRKATFKLNIDPYVLEYTFIKFFKKRVLMNLILPIFGNQTFKYESLHGFTGTYSEYVLEAMIEYNRQRQEDDDALGDEVVLEFVDSDDDTDNDSDTDIDIDSDKDSDEDSVIDEYDEYDEYDIDSDYDVIDSNSDVE